MILGTRATPNANMPNAAPAALAAPNNPDFASLPDRLIEIMYEFITTPSPK